MVDGNTCVFSWLHLLLTIQWLLTNHTSYQMEWSHSPKAFITMYAGVSFYYCYCIQRIKISVYYCYCVWKMSHQCRCHLVYCSHWHYNDVIMETIASQITSLTIVYSTAYSDADQSKHQSSASLAFVRGIHRCPVNSPHKWPVKRKMFPFDDVIMEFRHVMYYSVCHPIFVF